jgi:hypothetical protein
MIPYLTSCKTTQHTLYFTGTKLVIPFVSNLSRKLKKQTPALPILYTTAITTIPCTA